MVRKPHHCSLRILISLALAGCIVQSGALAQTLANTGTGPHQAPLSHYYWHFLAHQNQLDAWAKTQAAKGHDGSALRNHLQKSIGLSDADYAPVRTSAVRLTTEVKALNAQAQAIRAAGPTAESYAQLKALTAQRESDIDSEVAYLKKSLSPNKRAKLEAFMVQFFSPPKLPPTNQQTAPAAVQP
jgi:hypothetical protein